MKYLLTASWPIAKLFSRSLVNIRPKLLLPSNRCYSKATCRWGLSLFQTQSCAALNASRPQLNATDKTRTDLLSASWLKVTKLKETVANRSRVFIRLGPEDREVVERKRRRRGSNGGEGRYLYDYWDSAKDCVFGEGAALALRAWHLAWGSVVWPPEYLVRLHVLWRLVRA